MVASAYPKFSLVLYFYAETEKGKFPGQITIQDETAEGFTNAMTTVVSELVSTDEDQVVKYEPREVSSPAYAKSGGGGGNKPVATAAPSNVPNCPIHNTPLRKRNSQFGVFYSCGEKNPDGTWCNWKPPREVV